MNNNIVFLSDSHFGTNNSSKSIFETQLSFFDDQFFPYLIENGIKEVIHLGDFVHNRNNIDLWILQELKTRFFKWFDENNIKLHILVGNHDCYFRDRISHNFLSENTNEFKNIFVYDRAKTIKIGKYSIAMIPWIVDQKTFSVPKKCDIIAGHFEMNNFPMMKNIMSKGGFDANIFKDIKLVFSGHYHIKSRQDNIIYTGTQYQLTYNDFDEEKGFYVLKDNYELDYIKNIITPKFIKLYYDDDVITVSGLETNKTREITKDKAKDIVSTNYSKIYVKKCKNLFNFDIFYNSLCEVSKNDYKIEIIDTEQVVENFNLTEFEETLETDTNTIDLIRTFIDGMTFEENIEKNLLMSLSSEMYQLAQDESLGLSND